MSKAEQNFRSSLWERNKHLLYHYGHYYATICGLVMINYIPAKSRNSWSHRFAIFYSHLLSATLIIALPIYFGMNLSELIVTNDRQRQLQLLVTFANTVLKYATFVLTYVANLANYRAIQNVTITRQHLEDTFGLAWSEPRRRFERFLIAKFLLINATMFVQWSNIVYQYWMEGIHSVRGQFAIYSFVLWNYTENMADYFYFMIASALKFYRQLRAKLSRVYRKAQQLQGQRNRGFRIQLCCDLCDRVDQISLHYKEIALLLLDSLKMQELQMLGLVLTALIGTLSNLFTIFTLLGAINRSEYLPTLILSALHTVVFYLDNYIIVEITSQILIELRNINFTMRRFNELKGMDERLEQTLEKFTVQMLDYKVDFRICGLFTVDQTLVASTASAILSYFITLIQLAMNWNTNSLNNSAGANQTNVDVNGGQDY